MFFGSAHSKGVSVDAGRKVGMWKGEKATEGRQGRMEIGRKRREISRARLALELNVYPWKLRGCGVKGKPFEVAIASGGKHGEW